MMSLRGSSLTKLASYAEGKSAGASPHYPYCPLPSTTSIRLIELLPGKDSDPICCSLCAVNLEDTPLFEALSYVWGDPKITKPIFCSDRDNVSRPQKSTLQVTVNCWHALHRLRLEGKTRLLWIDAICINQEDLYERDRQVLLMGELYRKAACVPVYLGGDEDLPEVFELFRSLAKKAAAFPAGVGVSAFSGVGSFDYSQLLSFRKFFDRPWFKRCWTMQEIGLARRAMLICDGDELEWDVFFSVISWINTNQPLDTIHLDLPTRELVTSVSLYRKFENGETDSFIRPPDFLDVLEATRTRQAGEPKDRIYAFLGHATAVDEKGPLVVPYYAQWNWIVFYQFALTYIKRTQNLRILSAVDHGEHLPPAAFPLSWIPWWNPSEYLCNFGMSSTVYDASAGSKESQSIRLGGKPLEELDIDQVLDDSPLLEWEDLVMSSSGSDESIEAVHQRFLSNILTRQISKFSLGFPMPTDTDSLLALYQPEEARLSVKGLILDEVRLVWPVFDKTDIAMHSFSNEKDPKKHYIEVLCNSLHGDDFRSRYDDSLLALSLTMVAGVHGSKPANEDLDAHRASFTAYRHAVQTARLTVYDNKQQLRDGVGDAVGSGLGLATEEKNHEQLPRVPGWQRFMIDAVNVCHHRRFFTTTSGFFGLGPEAMLGEGIVVILFGASVPFILQKIGDLYRLVGEAYVHGVMKGEAVEMWKRGELEDVDFQLI